MRGKRGGSSSSTCWHTFIGVGCSRFSIDRWYSWIWVNNHGCSFSNYGWEQDGDSPTLHCLPAGGGGSLLDAPSSTEGSAITVVGVSSTASSTVVSMGG